MEKLKVFSKKMQEEMEVTFGSNGRLVTPEGIELQDNGIVCAWNNSSGSWIDQGWNNSSGSWQDKGWNNSSGSWIDNGWNNSSGNWMDKGWSNSSGNWGDSGGNSGGCYITTACVNFKGLSDNCHEMEILRKYRDELVKEDEEFRAKILEYYRKAPLIVQHIEHDKEKDSVLEGLYQDMILPCVSLLENGQTEEAKTRYLDSYEKLVRKYLAS